MDLEKEQESRKAKFYVPNWFSVEIKTGVSGSCSPCVCVCVCVCARARVHVTHSILFFDIYLKDLVKIRDLYFGD